MTLQPRDTERLPLGGSLLCAATLILPSWTQGTVDVADPVIPPDTVIDLIFQKSGVDPGGTDPRPYPGAEVEGTGKKWQRMSLTFAHDEVVSESDDPNPFTDYRLNVILVHLPTQEVVTVPGFFAADGDAADTSATSGDKWRAYFSPHAVGTWHYMASFRQGSNIAVELDPNAGTPESFDGAWGTFEVTPADPDAPGFLSKGLLEYVGEYHMRFAENHEFYLKAGTDSPENLLGYVQFDNTTDLGGLDEGVLAAMGGLHHLTAHAGSFDPDDPYDVAATWGNSQGEPFIGALNYLSEQAVNSVYFLTYNIDGGDGMDTWPWVDPGDTDKDRFDVSKLDQWERIFSHMDVRGIQLHMVLQETENDLAMGGLSFERKLYFREMVARFAHHLALLWNLGEENNNTDPELIEFADYIRALDPYDHYITVHIYYGEAWTAYDGLFGPTNFEATSIQGLASTYNDHAIFIRNQSDENGRRWATYGDENYPPVDEFLGNLDYLRHVILWGNYCGGGGGIEWYFGYNSFYFGDIASDDFTVLQPLWEDTRHATDFFQRYLSFWEMKPKNSLTSDTDDYVLAQEGETYVIYRPNGWSTHLDLDDHDATFTVDWYDPRNGGPLQTGSDLEIDGPGSVWIGYPPTNGEDWVALIRRKTNQKPQVIEVSAAPDPHPGDAPATLQVRVSDPDGPDDVDRVEIHLWSPDGTYQGAQPATYRGGNLYSVYADPFPQLESGLWHFAGVAYDKDGLRSFRVSNFEVD